jgi:putative transposase
MQVSVHRAYKASGLCRSRHYYQSRKDDTEVIQALQTHIEQHPTHGFPKTFAYLRRQGNEWNHKRVYRVYTILNYNKRRKGKRRLPQRIKQAIEPMEKINQSWSIDFMSDSLVSGRKFRTFNVLDDFNREVLAIEIAVSLPAVRIIRVLDQIISWRGKPARIRMDNGPEFISNVFEAWCKDREIELLYIQPGKPTQNSLIERLNGSYRRDVLDAYLFYELDEVRALTQEWIEEYNERRPHESLKNKTPKEWAELTSQASEKGHALFPKLETTKELEKSLI